jgi:protein required for attachment to host cells
VKIPHGSLVFVVDGEKLLLFRNEGDERYAVLETLRREERVATATHEQGSDEPGQSFSSFGSRRSAYANTDWHRQDEERFAIHAAKVLEVAAEEIDTGIVVLAAPRTLGVLRKHLGWHSQIRLLAEIDKDFAHRSTDDVIAAIAAYDNAKPDDRTKTATLGCIDIQDSQRG